MPESQKRNKKWGANHKHKNRKDLKFVFTLPRTVNELEILISECSMQIMTSMQKRRMLNKAFKLKANQNRTTIKCIP